MALELIAAFISAIACAGIGMLLRKLSGGRLPKWLVPAAAGAGMIGFAVVMEYGWFGRQAAALPEGVVVVWEDQRPQALRPWTMAVPMTSRFLAMDTRSLAAHPGDPDLILAEVYGFARWQGIEQALLVVDCATDRSVRLTAAMKIDDSGVLTGGEWAPMAEGDTSATVACGRANDG
ncbi:MAG: hypothetical protein O9292_09765 [Rhodobacteraceae bacterium]|jgi:hypothetical protein|nr:hypothetical protein [Paracoccaceae bacterium]MCZ8152659.1 hypothetical protein [Paracoccaceae bacterium]MCZ8335598.1 hypothetical protein [Paracoccaceae bacterium]